MFIGSIGSTHALLPEGRTLRNVHSRVHGSASLCATFSSTNRDSE
jgi:hypothetical protein